MIRFGNVKVSSVGVFRAEYSIDCADLWYEGLSKFSQGCEVCVSVVPVQSCIHIYIYIYKHTSIRTAISYIVQIRLMSYFSSPRDLKCYPYIIISYLYSLFV